MLILSVNWPLVVLGHIVVIFIFRSRDREVPAVIVLADFAVAAPPHADRRFKSAWVRFRSK